MPSAIEREGARVLLFDERERLLVMRAHDPHDRARTWWFTPGGGVEAGEDARGAAARELQEETGYVIAPGSLVGPVWERTAYFDFMTRPYVQHEVFFVATVDMADAPGTPAWTLTEEEAIDEVAWLSQAELADAAIEVFPAELREPWSLLCAWDGTTRNLGDVTE